MGTLSESTDTERPPLRESAFVEYLPLGSPQRQKVEERFTGAGERGHGVVVYRGRISVRGDRGIVETESGEGCMTL